MKRILICWLGFTDLRAAKDPENVGLGPIAQAVEARNFDEVALISDQPKEATNGYINGLSHAIPPGFNCTAKGYLERPISGRYMKRQ